VAASLLPRLLSDIAESREDETVAAAAAKEEEAVDSAALSTAALSHRLHSLSHRASGLEFISLCGHFGRIVSFSPLRSKPPFWPFHSTSSRRTNLAFFCLLFSGPELWEVLLTEGANLCAVFLFSLSPALNEALIIQKKGRNFFSPSEEDNFSPSKGGLLPFFSLPRGFSASNKGKKSLLRIIFSPLVG